MCKLLEKIINKRLKWYLETKNIITPYQHGFRQHHSTTDNLIFIESSICNAFYNKQHLIAVALDMEKAYDMLWRYRIIKILSELNIHGNMLHFITNFLKKRYINVRVNGKVSETFEIINGVPQGSIISVTLFLIAINDITKVIPAPVEYTLYADDVTVLLAGKNIETSQKLLQVTLNNLQTFANEHGFKFSKNKTTVTIFSKQNSINKELKLFLQNHKLSVTSEMKILGLTFDQKLTWIPH